MLGAFGNEAQTNYFFDGKPLYNTYNDTYTMDEPTWSAFHTYIIEWTDKILTFSVDDKTLKTWRNGEIPAAHWPQVPMQVKIGVWAVTDESAAGEIQWAGGLPDWQGDDPFQAYYKNVEIHDYAAGCQSHVDEDGVKYEWREGMTGWRDVKVMGCERREPQGFTPDGTSGSETLKIPAITTATLSGGDSEPPTTTEAIRSTGPASSGSDADATANVPTATESRESKESDEAERESADMAAPMTGWLSSALVATVLVGWVLVFGL